MSGNSTFNKVCVIGAGVMGTGIAAHFANAGFKVLLLDIVDPKYLSSSDKNLRSSIAKNGLIKALKQKPAPFFSKNLASQVETGNLEDDLGKLKDCHWVIEAVIESLPVKHDLFAKLEKSVGPFTIVSSNTSGLSIEKMLEGRSLEFRARFLVTHFFNPVRYLHLLEIVSGQDTSPVVVSQIAQIGANRLGKGIVFGKDTPNFVANRIGVFGMMETMRLMKELNYSVDEVDAIFGPALGRPKSAVFRTADVVGLDTFFHVAKNCYDSLPNDERHDVFQIPDFLNSMVEKGWLGQKSGQGFYKKEGAEILSLDIKTMSYRAKEKIRFESLGAARRLDDISERVKYIVNSEDRAGQLAWKIFSSTSIYASFRLGEIADDIVQIDNAMKWGFGFEQGPFETWDAVGVGESVARMRKEGLEPAPWVDQMLRSGRISFYQSDELGEITFWDPRIQMAAKVQKAPRARTLGAVKKRAGAVLNDSSAFSLIDIGERILAVEFHTKMNALDAEVMGGINNAIDLCESGKFDALVLTNEGANFSVGANIFLLYMAAQQGMWDQIDEMVKGFQQTCQRLKYSSIPTVSAPFQLTLGGGCEVSMWCNSIRAQAETYMGLVEVGVGLIPGGGGNIEMLARTLQGAVDDPNFPTEPMIRRAFETVAMAKVSTSAVEAKELMFLAATDGIVLNKEHQLMAARAEAAGMAQAGFTPPLERTFRLPGKSAHATFEMVLNSMLAGKFISEHDLKISLKVSEVMTGGNCTPRERVTEQYLLDLEREAFLSLCGEEKTQARIAYMLEHNKPLRN